MNLNDYFSQAKTYHLTDETKSVIFDKIRQKRFETIVAKSYFFSTRRVVYRGLSAMIILGTGGFLVQQNVDIDHLFFSIRSQNGTNTVSADYIAKLINITGERHIQRGDQIISVPYLNEGDTLFLKDGTEVIFTLEDGTKGKITGPAMFSVSKIKNNHYQIQLGEGHFFQLSNNLSKNIIEVVSDDMTIMTNKNQKIDFQLAKNETETLIKNDGGDIKISQNTVENTEIAANTEMDIKHEVVSVKLNDINHIADSRSFYLFLKNNNISETISLNDLNDNADDGGYAVKDDGMRGDEINNNTGGGEQLALLNYDDLALLMQETQSGDTSITSQDLSSGLLVDLGFNDEKKVPNEEQNNLLTNVLNSFFLQNSFDRIEVARSVKDTGIIENEIKSLKSKLVSIQSLFGLEILNGDISSMASQLSRQLQSKYYISPSVLSELDKLVHFSLE
ncbi:hypothetical protein AGMMS50249_3940 [candidate division SR1 bacterium]|nr:hypothetical protein AGMMS50249_3940 [candidate division SR1 bacterium]